MSNRGNTSAEPEKIVLVGAGGHAKVVIALAHALGHAVVALVDRDPEKLGRLVSGVPVVGSAAEVADAHGCGFVLSIGDNRTRAEFAAVMKVRFVSLVHPWAWVAPSAEIGPGAVVFAGCVVQPDARVGAHAIVNTGATIDHDCTLGSFVHVAPGAHLAGQVRVGEGAFLGVGCAVKNGVEVGAWATLGAGAVAVHDVSEGVVAVGIPARDRSEEG